MGWSEVQKTDVSRDDSRAGATRTFRVWNYNPAQLIADPTVVLGGPDNTGLPNYGDPHPGNASLTLRRYSTSAQGFTFDATAEYSDGDIAVFPPPSLDYAWKGGFQTEDAKIPFGVLTSTKVQGFLPSNSEPGTPVPVSEVFDWEFKEQQILETRVRHSRKVRLTANLADTLKVLEFHNNKLMNLMGTWYRFEAGDYSQLSSTTFEMTYSLTMDSGTPLIALGTQTLSLAFPRGPYPHPHQIITSSAGREEWTRPPFCELIIYRTISQVTQEPEVAFKPFCPYELSGPDGLGWQEIPGF